ncbi:MAG: hypothetical protein DRN53_04325 [Thermoprotei archaeon]|nr:MAG: hypothetical protein DRN53_04325 [Thermoprotei archaeon]
MMFLDCDILVTKHGFIFYTIGYEHPDQRVVSNLKYIPREYAKLFNLEWLKHKWILEGRELVRPKVLFSPRVYQSIIKTFMRYFPEYVYYSNQLQKYIISVPIDLIDRVYRPSESLKRIMNKKRRDPLENKVVNLVEELSGKSGISLKYFGVSGSVSLGMHRSFSDMDIIVYGLENYYKVRNTLILLEKEGLITMISESALDEIRMNRGLYQGTRFNINAVRLQEEIKTTPCLYRPICTIEVKCRVLDARESIFRPAVYRVRVEDVIRGPRDISPYITRVVSMIGLHRMIATEDDIIIVKGILEEVTDVDTSIRSYRIFVGSASQNEYIKNLSRGIS